MQHSRAAETPRAHCRSGRRVCRSFWIQRNRTNTGLPAGRSRLNNTLWKQDLRMSHAHRAIVR